MSRSIWPKRLPRLCLAGDLTVCLLKKTEQINNSFLFKFFFFTQFTCTSIPAKVVLHLAYCCQSNIYRITDNFFHNTNTLCCICIIIADMATEYAEGLLQPFEMSRSITKSAQRLLIFLMGKRQCLHM